MSVGLPFKCVEAPEPLSPEIMNIVINLMEILNKFIKLPLQDEEGLPLRVPAAQILVGKIKWPKTLAHCSFLMIGN